MKRVVVKLGGSVITRKSENVMQVRYPVLKRLSKELSRGLGETGIQAVVVHGAGAYGHVPANMHRLHEGFIDEGQIEGVVETRKNMEELNQIVVDSLISNGVPAVGCQPSSAGVLENKRIKEYVIKPVENMLKVGLTPVAYGDVLTDTQTGFNILSGDQLSTYLALKVGAQEVVMVGDYDGVYKGSPGESEKIPVLTRENIKEVMMDDGVLILTTPNKKLRLLPFQSPRNPHHVKEYSPEELKEILNNVFPYTKVKGLFGTQKINKIEKERLKQNPLMVYLIHPLWRLVPSFLKQMWRKKKKEKRRKPEKKAFEKEKWSVEDFKVLSETKDCLDIIGICQK